jgi:hypothetical protein
VIRENKKKWPATSGGPFLFAQGFKVAEFRGFTNKTSKVDALETLKP